MTIEGIKTTTFEHVKTAWNELNVVQCGYCQSGQIMMATHLLSKKGKPSDSDIENYFKGNICRCATYQRIKKAVKLAFTLKEG